MIYKQIELPHQERVTLAFRDNKIERLSYTNKEWSDYLIKDGEFQVSFDEFLEMYLGKLSNNAISLLSSYVILMKNGGLCDE